MIDLETLWRIIDEGSTPAIAVIAYFLWRVDRRLETFIIEIKTLAKTRDKKLESIHNDINLFIRRMADLEKNNAK